MSKNVTITDMSWPPLGKCRWQWVQ